MSELVHLRDPKKCLNSEGHSFKDVGLNLAECRHCGMVIMHGGFSQDSSWEFGYEGPDNDSFPDESMLFDDDHPEGIW
jgi:hypothetical protein